MNEQEQKHTPGPWEISRDDAYPRPGRERETMNARSNQETERAPVHALADACRLLVAAIEQINASCQTREQRVALAVGRAALKKAGAL